MSNLYRTDTTAPSRQNPFKSETEALEGQGASIDWDNVGIEFAIGAFPVVVDQGDHAEDDTELTIEALAYPLAKGAIIDFGAGDILILDAPAVAGATTLTTKPASEAIANDAVGYADRYGHSSKRIPKGTAVVVDDTTKKFLPRVNRQNAETASLVLKTDANEVSETDAPTGYGTYRNIMCYEKLMPDYASASWATIKAELVANDISFIDEAPTWS